MSAFLNKNEKLYFCDSCSEEYELPKITTTDLKECFICNKEANCYFYDLQLLIFDMQLKKIFKEHKIYFTRKTKKRIHFNLEEGFFHKCSHCFRYLTLSDYQKCLENNFLCICGKSILEIFHLEFKIKEGDDNLRFSTVFLPKQEINGWYETALFKNGEFVEILKRHTNRKRAIEFHNALINLLYG